jgi:predicted amidohydrolase YtcJ
MLIHQKILSLRTATSFLLCIVLSCSCNQQKKVSMIVYNANIYTVDSSFSTAEAMAIEDGKILETGTSDYILDKYKSDNKIDVSGKTIFPGFIDAHCHFTGFATDSWKCELTGTSSFQEIIDKVKAYSTNAPMYWIYGRGWDQNDWQNKSFPDKKLLDSLFPNRPVFLKRIDGHAALANQKALDIAGVLPGKLITGGSFESNNGKLTGMLIDNAMDEVERFIPQISDSLAKKYFFEMQQKCFALGLTGVHDCGINEHTVDLIDEAQKQGLLKMKIFALLSDSLHYYDKWIAKGPYKTDKLHVGGFKLYADGALGSRGACLLKDYEDQAGWKGFLLSNQSHFQEVAEKLSQSSFQMCTHAIGDSGNRTILNTYAKVLNGKNDKRWRIEHAQVMDSSDFHFFKENNIIPSVQPTHATSDMYWAEARIGKSRIPYAYAYKQLLEQNNWMPLGTDFPVEDISPFKTFFAAVFRQDSKGYPEAGFQLNNALTREQAIRGMTIWAAQSAFEEKEKGSIESGKAADFIILDKDLMHCKKEEVLSAKTVHTYVNGELVF